MNGAHGTDGGRVRILAAGDAAVLVEFPGSGGPVSPAVLPFTAAAARGRPAGIVDVIPAARTVAVTFSPAAIAPDVVRTWCADLSARAVADAAGADGSAEPPGEALVIPVVYDGPDLDAVAGATGLTRAEVIDAHTGTGWTVAFTGFAPGFGYLVGGDPRLEVPRRSTPRTRVPAGSVGLAGPFSGVYPRSSPGGWQLIGTTAAELWQPRRDPPALLAPGTRVRFARAGEAA